MDDARVEPVTTTSVRVLIVDDQLPFREASRMVVEMTDGFEVAGEAENGEQGLAMISELHPDLVLVDVQMPGIDGIETTRRISVLPDAPVVVVMSTHESGDYRGAAVAAGAVDFIPKSQFGMDTLVEVWTRSRAGAD
ncbi:MAG: response regulator transcription factor [Actinomycetota bacterium]|nr:response regulator transcription factor [Actinomycetota bacterium]